MAIYMYDAENVEFKFSRLRRHLKIMITFRMFIAQILFKYCQKGVEKYILII